MLIRLLRGIIAAMVLLLALVACAAIFAATLAHSGVIPRPSPAPVISIATDNHVREAAERRIQYARGHWAWVISSRYLPQFDQRGRRQPPGIDYRPEIDRVTAALKAANTATAASAVASLESIKAALQPLVSALARGKGVTVPGARRDVLADPTGGRVGSAAAAIDTALRDISRIKNGT